MIAQRPGVAGAFLKVNMLDPASSSVNIDSGTADNLQIVTCVR
ncbi:MAG: hypothetical protein WCK83_05845 [Burkholderiales bacterium]